MKFYLRNALAYYRNQRRKKLININKIMNTYKPNLEQQSPAPQPVA